MSPKSRTRASFLLALCTIASCVSPPPPVIMPAAGPDAVERLADELALEDEQEAPSPEAAFEAAQVIAAEGFVDPHFDGPTTASILAEFSHIDPGGIVPKVLRDRAILYFKANRSKFANGTYITVIDYGRRSTDPRFFIMNTSSGAVMAYRSAHGSGSDLDHDGWADSFGNVPKSKKSSLGFMRTGVIYQSNLVGTALKLHGLSTTNSNVFPRGIVVHGSKHVKDESIVQGRSQGCPSVPTHQYLSIVQTLAGGSLVYAGNSRELLGS